MISAYRVCANCGLTRRNHVKDKCLFMPTTFVSLASIPYSFETLDTAYRPVV